MNWDDKTVLDHRKDIIEQLKKNTPLQIKSGLLKVFGKV